MLTLTVDSGHQSRCPSCRPPPASSQHSNSRRLHEAGSKSQLASSCPPSGGSPTGPALRANPSPEVTDLFCRLPLPTLFYRPEAVHLGDLLRISVRPGTRVTEALPRIFKGRRQRTGRHLKCGARPSRGAYLRPTRFQARGSSRRKDNSSRDCRRRLRVRSRCRHRPRPTPCSGSGMLTRFPVAG